MPGAERRPRFKGSLRDPISRGVQPDDVCSGTFLASRSDLGSEYSSLRLPKLIAYYYAQQPWCLWARDNASPAEEGVERLEQSPGVVGVAERTRLHGKRRSSGRMKDLQGHFHDPGIRHSEVSSCRFGDIDEPVPGVWAPVVDPHHDAVAAFHPPDPYVGAERKRAMGGGKRLRIVRFATCGNLPVKGLPVPACEALFRACVRPRERPDQRYCCGSGADRPGWSKPIEH